MFMEQVVIAGFGGQGVQLIGQLLTYAGMNDGRFVSYLPSYGAEMRGGPTNCNVILSEEEIGSPIISEATCAIVMNGPSLAKSEKLVVEGGALILNSSLVHIESGRKDVKAFKIPANDLANELGNDRVANMVLLGAYIEYSKAVKPESIMYKLKDTFGERRAHLLPVNEKALEAGAKCIREQM